MFDIYEFFNKYQNNTLPEDLYLYDPDACGMSGDCAEVVYKVDEEIKQYIIDHINDFMQMRHGCDDIKFYPTLRALYDDYGDYFPLKGLVGDFDVKFFEKDYRTSGIEDFKEQYNFGD